MTIDPGLGGDEPSDEELARQDALRSATRVADLFELDLDDPGTPSRRGAGGEPQPDAFHVPLVDYGGNPADAR